MDEVEFELELDEIITEELCIITELDELAVDDDVIDVLLLGVCDVAEDATEFEVLLMPALLDVPLEIGWPSSALGAAPQAAKKLLMKII